MTTILNPRVGGSDRKLKLACPPLDLNGKTVAFLDNGKKNFDVYLDRTEELLRESFTFNSFRRRKALPIKGISPDLLEELVERCDVVITGSGDWGSCSSWSVHDVVQFEKRGVPAVAICTDVFEATARFQTKALGLPEARIVIVPHPFSGIDPAEVKKKAESAFATLVAKLLDPRGHSIGAAV